MATRMGALRHTAALTGEQLGEGAGRLLQEAQQRNVVTFALVAVSGFALGLLAGLIFAPTSGSETRQRISERTGSMISSAREATRRGAERATGEISEQAEKIA